MNVVYKNLEQYSCVIRAYRLARWANHAWGLLPDGALPEVWNICPSVFAFCQLLPGYAVAKGWVTEGPAGYGVLGPVYEDGALAVYIGIGGKSQAIARLKPGESTVGYEHGVRYAEATLADGIVVGAGGYRAEPRDWARLARLLIVAEEPTDLEAQGIAESLRNMVGEEPAAQEEFDKYFALNGPEILAGPEVIMVERR
jgi:hypothetical protein